MAIENHKDASRVAVDPSLLEWAEYWYPISWKGVLAGGVITAVGACATIAFLLMQWRTTTIREEQSDWRTTVVEAETAKAKQETARLNNETARLQADNLALQTVLLPRHAGLIGLDEEPRAKTWFAGFDRWAGTKILIQVIPGDPEAQNLANEIAIILSKFGWKPELIDEKRSGVSLNLREGLEVISPSSYKAWGPKNEAQQAFAALRDAAISLARALTNAGLGVGSYPVSGVNGLMMIVDFPPDSEDKAHNPFRNFSPRLDGVYLQVGSRPVASTMQWIRQGRPDELGNKAASAVPAQTPK